MSTLRRLTIRACAFSARASAAPLLLKGAAGRMTGHIGRAVRRVGLRSAMTRQPRTAPRPEHTPARGVRVRWDRLLAASRRNPLLTDAALAAVHRAGHPRTQARARLRALLVVSSWPELLAPPCVPAFPVGVGAGHGGCLCHGVRRNHAVIAGQCRVGTVLMSLAGPAGLRCSACSPCGGPHVPVLPVWRPAGRAGAELLLARWCCPTSPASPARRPGSAPADQSPASLSGPARGQARFRTCYSSLNGI